MTPDPSLHDEQLEDEIRLVGELVLAASQSAGRLSQDAIDVILGVRQAPCPAGGVPPGPASDEPPGPAGPTEG